MSGQSMDDPKQRVFSGIQPTGEAHLGNYLGAIRNWVQLVDQYECLYCIVDLHAITLPYEPAELPGRVFDLAVSLLAAGLDPERCTLFVQSDIPEHAELAWVFNSVTPVGELQRMTQFKEKSGGRESVNAGVLDYPVLQAADILLYHGELVPVGEDQLQHLELSREIARRWNSRYGDYFPEPQPLVSHAPRILGLDGASKMSKSAGNTIPFLAEPEEIGRRLAAAVTDPDRVRRDDPGNPNVCNIYALHGHFSPAAVREEVEARCQTATIGCVDCKRRLADQMSSALEPMRERARELRADPDRVYEILDAGAERCRRMARETLEEVYERMGLSRRHVAAQRSG
jgi:tryptophanyl-tRNA synthetase